MSSSTGNINSLNEQSKRTQAIWKSSLISASRTALACILVGCITLYGPASLKEQVAFPAFSYVTVVLIVTNASLGDTIRGCWHALFATLQGVGPAILCLIIVGPTRLTAISTSVVLAISAFFIVLPEWTHIVAKRIALGQIVILYVIGYFNKEHTHAVMHPIHVAASTAVGAFSCLLALFFPYPLLAYSEVKQNSKLFAENASERLKLFVKAFCAEDSGSSQALISQAKCLAAKGRKFLQCIKSRQDSMHWERFPIQFLRPYCKDPGDRFQELETPLKGMEIALSNSTFPVSISDEQFKDRMNTIEGEISQNLEQVRSHLPCESLTVPESDAGHVMDSLQTLETFPSSDKDLPSYFFLFCMKLLYTQSRVMTFIPNTPKVDKTSLAKHNGLCFEDIWANWPITLSKKRLMPALKSSLSLGFAVLFGLYYSRPDGFWAGLPVAISLAAGREPTFKVANVKFQGTVIGTVFGVLGCVVFQKASQFRFLSLFPWFIFTSFLQQSKMYGQAGGVSAVIGAVLILGRKNFGPPKDFAIARIVETFIGLSCSIMVELVLQPTRASSLAKVQLSETLGTLRNSLSSVNVHAMSKSKLMDRQKLLKTHVNDLGKFVSDAEVEPNFWFLPFHSAAYGRLVSSLSKITDLLIFLAHANGSLEEQLQGLEQMGCKDEIDAINIDIENARKMTNSSIKSLQEISSIKSLVVLEKDLVKHNKSCDLELGKSAYNNQLNLDDNEINKIMRSLLDHFKEVVEKLEVEEEEKKMKTQLVLSFSALGFCLSCLMKETREIQKGIQEVIQWENPSSQINLHEISCKIHALYD